MNRQLIEESRVISFWHCMTLDYMGISFYENDMDDLYYMIEQLECETLESEVGVS